MAIDVVCENCKTKFQVSNKYAGKEGPCPKCKNNIVVSNLVKPDKPITRYSLRHIPTECEE